MQCILLTYDKKELGHSIFCNYYLHLLPPLRPPKEYIRTPTDATAWRQRRISSNEGSCSVCPLLLREEVTSPFLSNQTPAAVSNTI